MRFCTARLTAVRLRTARLNAGFIVFDVIVSGIITARLPTTCPSSWQAEAARWRPYATARLSKAQFPNAGYAL